MSEAKRKPTFTLCVNDAPSGAAPRWRSIGAAWESARGNLFVKVDEGCRLEGTAMLFPYREKPSGGFTRRPDYRRPVMRPTPAPAAPPPEVDYMERQRAERKKRTQPPVPEGDTVDLNVEPPDDAPWL